MAFEKALIERTLGAELSHTWGIRRAGSRPTRAPTTATVRAAKWCSNDGLFRVEVPREREGSFEPPLIAKHERRFTGFDDKIIAMYARGMTV